MYWMAGLASSEARITEMFLSEEPCATALTPMLLRPRAASILPVVPR